MTGVSHGVMGVGVLVCGLLFGAAVSVGAQVRPRDIPIVAQPQQRFNSGQDIQPVFEGWARKPDGDYVFHFGYLNRNYREQPSIPVGPDNFFSPGSEDRGQPTYFFPRTRRYQFEVDVPAGFGLEDELVWSVTAHGSKQQAIGWLQPEWEIDVNTITSNTRMGNGRGEEELYTNRRPSVSVEASESSVAVGGTVKLIATLTDDELPTEAPRRAPRRDRTPSLIPPDDAPEIPDNIEWASRASPPRNGLAVLWMVYRGPADASFDPSGYQRSVSEDEGNEPDTGRIPSGPPPGPTSTNLEGDGWTMAKFETEVTFDQPGTYTLRAVASDSMLLTPADVTIIVH